MRARLRGTAGALRPDDFPQRLFPCYAITKPGTERRWYLEENVAALEVVITPEELARIDEAAPKGAAAGTRYPEAGMAAVNR